MNIDQRKLIKEELFNNFCMYLDICQFWSLVSVCLHLFASRLNQMGCFVFSGVGCDLRRSLFLTLCLLQEKMSKDVVRHICLFLEPREICVVREVCWLWKRAVDEGMVWEQCLER